LLKFLCVPNKQDIFCTWQDYCNDYSGLNVLLYKIHKKEIDMPVSDVKEGTSSLIISTTRQRTGPAEFSGVLRGSVSESEKASPQSGKTENSAQKNSDSSPFIELGRISKETPTVSHILKHHPEYAGKCWDIIFSSENREKPFTKMRDGTSLLQK
jgi:hypothetical protein